MFRHIKIGFGRRLGSFFAMLFISICVALCVAGIKSCAAGDNATVNVSSNTFVNNWVNGYDYVIYNRSDSVLCAIRGDIKLVDGLYVCTGDMLTYTRIGTNYNYQYVYNVGAVTDFTVNMGSYTYYSSVVGRLSGDITNYKVVADNRRVYLYSVGACMGGGVVLWTIGQFAKRV